MQKRLTDVSGTTPPEDRSNPGCFPAAGAPRPQGTGISDLSCKAFLLRLHSIRTSRIRLPVDRISLRLRHATLRQNGP